MKQFLTLFVIAALVAACSQKTTPPATETKAYTGPKYSYATHIAPLMERSCAPCHYPAQDGKKLPLDSYAATKVNLAAVLERVQLPSDDVKHMPFKSKKPALSAEEIAMLKNWARGGFGE